jgi:predicted nucleic acid binding AN1-type Zn finger protein
MRCSCKDCTKKTSIIGHCNYCYLSFCIVHRLPEEHNCAEISKVKSNAKETNMKQLMKNKVVDKKV